MKIRLDDSMNFDQLSEMLEGYTGSDIKDVVQDVYMRVVKEYSESDGKIETVRAVNINDFTEAIK